MINVLVLIDYSSEFSRRFLTGLIRYSNENGPWTFYRLPAYYKALFGETGIIERIKEWEIDAVLAQWEYEEIGFLEKLNIPVFLQSYKEESGCFSKISGDFKGTGIMAAIFFAKRRFKNFAFYGNKDFFWSKQRAEGYRGEVEKCGGNYYYFESEVLHGTEWSGSHIDLDNWLLSLPKPVGLLACDDSFALQVSEMCKINDIDIPNELSLIGVDNDELICKLSYPSISSIITNDEQGGYDTGKMLYNSIINKSTDPFNINIDPIRIELRKSTEKYNISDEYVSRTVDYIEKNITYCLSIDKLIEEVTISRRSLEIRFKDAMGISLYQFVLDKKLNCVSDLLLNTNKDLLDIAVEVGFNDVRSIYRIFKKNKGYTPIKFRKKYSAEK
jgi:LacI family transcriptional regulator